MTHEIENLGIMNQGENSNAIAWNGSILVRGLSDKQAEEFLTSGKEILDQFKQTEYENYIEQKYGKIPTIEEYFKN